MHKHPRTFQPSDNSEGGPQVNLLQSRYVMYAVRFSRLSAKTKGLTWRVLFRISAAKVDWQKQSLKKFQSIRAT